MVVNCCNLFPDKKDVPAETRFKMAAAEWKRIKGTEAKNGYIQSAKEFGKVDPASLKGDDVDKYFRQQWHKLESMVFTDQLNLWIHEVLL